MQLKNIPEKYKIYLASISSGLLLSAAWWERSSPLLILVAFTPLLYIFDKYLSRRLARPVLIFPVVLVAFTIFNLLTFSWLRKASFTGSTLVILENSFLMSSVFLLALLVGKKSNKYAGFISLVSFWVTYEHIALNIKIISPWLNLGNVLGFNPKLIQWYEYTGISGGTFWILISNIILYQLSKRYVKNVRSGLKLLPVYFCFLLIPIIVSRTIYKRNTDLGERSNILVIQPNIDPYNEKFSGLPFEIQLRNMLDSASLAMRENEEWIILPETAVDDPFYETEAYKNRYVEIIDSFLIENQSANLLIGVTTIGIYRSKEGYNEASYRKIGGTDIYYQLFNSAMHVSQGLETEFYHKSKLVPGIEEKISGIPSFVSEAIIPKLGGTMSGYGTQSTREVFTHSKTGSIIAPVICYESVFGEYVTNYVMKGAELIFIITNDGWWENTVGYKQHLMFSSIRAIETRRSVARAANTGISCLVNQRGEITNPTRWWSADIILGEVSRNNKLTFYVRQGDLLYKYADIFSIFLLVISLVAIPLRKLKFSGRILI